MDLLDPKGKAEAASAPVPAWFRVASAPRSPGLPTSRWQCPLPTEYECNPHLLNDHSAPRNPLADSLLAGYPNQPLPSPALAPSSNAVHQDSGSVANPVPASREPTIGRWSWPRSAAVVRLPHRYSTVPRTPATVPPPALTPAPAAARADSRISPRLPPTNSAPLPRSSGCESVVRAAWSRPTLPRSESESNISDSAWSVVVPRCAACSVPACQPAHTLSLPLPDIALANASPPS